MLSVQTKMASLIHVPDTIAKYELHANEKIGQGAYGTVYRGRHADTNQKVAIKSIEPPVASRDTDFMKRIENELNLLGFGSPSKHRASAVP